MLRGLLSYGAARIFAGVGMFAAIVLLVRGLDDEAYGAYAQAVVLAQVCAYLGAGWIYLGMSRIVPGAEGKVRDDLLESVRVVLLAAVLVSGLVAAGVMLANPMEERAVMAAAVGAMAIATGLSEYALSQVSVAGAVRQFVLINVARYLLPLPFLSCLFFLGYLSAVSAILVLAGCAFFSSIYLIFRQPMRDRPERLAGSTFAMARHLAKLGVPALLIFSLWPATSLINRTFIPYFGSYTDLGNFAAVSDMINGPITLLFQVLSWTWVPSITAAVNTGNISQARTETSEFAGAVFLLALPGGVALWFAAPSLIALLAGESQLSFGIATIRFIALGSIGCCVSIGGLAILVAHRRLIIAGSFCGGVVLLSVYGAWLAGGDLVETAHNFATIMGLSATFVFLICLWVCRVGLNQRMWMASVVSSLAVLGLNSLATLLDAIDGINGLVVLLAGMIISCLIIFMFNVLGVRDIMRKLLLVRFNS